jgi:hypothetical protein
MKIEEYFPFSGGSDKRITAEKIEGLAGCHLFDDYPHLFGITENDGRTIRAYLQMDQGTYDFVSKLHEEFPDIMEPEREEYLEKVNGERSDRNLDPIVL